MESSDSKKSKKEIILVDDDRYAIETLSKLLTEDGYGVDMCFNGREALEKMKSKKYDLIITDLRMPEMGGMELLKNIKKIVPDIPVIIVTAFGEMGSYMDAFVRGVYDYINKPINYEELLRLLDTILKKNKEK